MAQYLQLCELNMVISGAWFRVNTTGSSEKAGVAKCLTCTMPIANIATMMRKDLFMKVTGRYFPLMGIN